MANYVFYGSDFLLSPATIDLSELEDNIRALNLTSATLQYSEGDNINNVTTRVVTIYFDNSLSSGDLIAVTGVVNTYTHVIYSSLCILKDLKSSGTDGGSFNSNVWQKRDLNTISGTVNYVTISSNQFILTAGRYLVIARSPAFEVDNHQIRIRNITDSISYLGDNGTSPVGSGVMTVSSVTIVVDVAVSTTFEIQHMCSSFKATDGLGKNLNFGSGEIYTTVFLNKLI
jgi:hypothetical protein